ADIAGSDDPVRVKTYELTAGALGAEITPPKFVDVAAGRDHSLAVDADGHVWATGSNAFGQLGVDTNGSSLNGFVMVPGLEGVKIVSVSAGDGFSLALSDDGDVYAWGRNTYGQLGLGHTYNVSKPTRVGLRYVSQISAGYDHALLLTHTGAVY